MNEQPFFFDGARAQLFGVYHAPDPQAQPAAPFVFSHPFGEEKLWAHRAFVSFARALARQGRGVLRFDYMGSGDSEGDFAAATVDTAVADLEAAIAQTKTRTGALQVGVMGLRLGASVAALAAERRGDIGSLVLWAPIVAGAPYLQELLRINLTTQLAVYREVREDREALGVRLAAGEAVNVDGYPMSPAMANELGRLNLLNGASRFDGRCLIAQLERNPAAPPSKDMQQLASRYGRATVQVVQEEPFWKEIARFYDTAPNLFPATLRWLDEDSSRT